MEPIGELKSKIDFGIITIRQDEFEAVLRRFPPTQSVEGRRRYAISSLKIANGEEYSIAMVGCPEQGTGEVQHVARDLIECRLRDKESRLHDFRQRCDEVASALQQLT